MAYKWHDPNYKLPKAESFFDKVVTYDKPQTYGVHKGYKVTNYRVCGITVWQSVEEHYF